MILKYIGISCLSLAALICGCSSVQAEKSDSPFEYREIYLAESMGKNAKNLGLNSVDYDWGVWGHNLRRVLPKNPVQNIFAKEGNSPNEEQFCFSSNHLFNYISEYISDNYGENDTIRFAILPNDNDIVCECAKCKAAGNTKTDASPAVFSMIQRLSAKYPNHMFFTSDYSTTKSIPDTVMAENVGVLISAMDYPRYAGATGKEQKFEERINQWKEKVNKVYIWDYVNNFDDYFTPVPIFNTMQRRLQMYERAGVNGVFLNGSGDDYSSFSKLQAEVLAALTEDPNLDWKPLLKELCNKYYPTAGYAIYDFMVAQEDYFASQGKELPLYDGVATALKSYLPGGRFVEFYNTLIDLSKKAGAQEKADLDNLIGALSLTRLELARLGGNVAGCEEALDRLSALQNRKIESYNEANWSIVDYVTDYNFINKHFLDIKDQNILKGAQIEALTPLDEDYSDVTILTDGLLGMPSNYHNGNLISSADPSLILKVPYVEGMKTLRVGFLRNHAYHIGLPLNVSLSYEGHIIKTMEPKVVKVHSGHGYAEFDIPSSVNGPLTLTITRNPDERTMAVDEIEATK